MGEKEGGADGVQVHVPPECQPGLLSLHALPLTRGPSADTPSQLLLLPPLIALGNIRSSGGIAFEEGMRVGFPSVAEVLALRLAAFKGFMGSRPILLGLEELSIAEASPFSSACFCRCFAFVEHRWPFLGQVPHVLHS